MKKLSECTVLVVDDTEENIDILVEALDSDYDVSVALDGKTALEIVETNPPDLILLDIMMPEMDGYQFFKELKINSATIKIPVIFLSAISTSGNKMTGFELGAVDYITKPFDILDVKSRVKTHLSLLLLNQELERQKQELESTVNKRLDESSIIHEDIVHSITTLAEFRKPARNNHIKRIQNYVKLLAENLKDLPRFRQFFDDQTIELLFKASSLHDIGKICISEQIINKPGKLTDEEFNEIKKHAELGRDSIMNIKQQEGNHLFLKFAKEIAYTHHEKWDGSGYPQGLKGEKIPISGRLMALADVYDSLISKRVYKEPISHDNAIDIIFAEKGKHFDPDLVDVFMEHEDKFRQVALEHADNEEQRNALSPKGMWDVD